MIVSPFRGWRPAPGLEARIPSPPYDVVSVAEARELAAGNPHSFLHVVRPEIDLPEDLDPHDDRVYATGRENLRSMIRDGILVQDRAPSYYVYRMVRENHTQTGVVGLASVSDYENGAIRKHENTRPAKEADRARHIETLAAHAGPVLLAYRDDPEVDAAVAEVARNRPAADFVAPDGVRHVLWPVDDPAIVEGIRTGFETIEATYIADGHHRAAAAARVAAARDDEASRSFLAIHFPASRLQVLEYNRVVRTLGGRTPDGFLEEVRNAGVEAARDDAARRPTDRWAYGMYLDGAWYRLRADLARIPKEDPVRSLDVAVLAEQLLEPVLGIRDPRADERIDFVGGIHGAEGLERRVDSNDFAVAFALRPTRLEDVMRVADAGEVMPPKSTWFEPKARSGMVVHVFG